MKNNYNLQNNNSKNKNKNNNINQNKGKKSPENNKYQKIIKSKYNIKAKSKSNSKNKYYENKNSNNYNKNIKTKKKENENSQNKKLKNQKSGENNNKNINNNKINKKGNSNKKEVLKNIDSHSNNKNKIKTTGDISSKNNKDTNLFSFVSPKNINNNNRIIKREIIIPIPRKCHFLKTTIEMDKEQFTLLNEKILLMKEKNKIFRHKRNEYNPTYGKNNYINKFNFYEEMINNRKFIEAEYEGNNTQNYLNNEEISKNNNQRTFINNRELNNYMNSRLVSPSILINRHIAKNLENKKKYKKKLTDVPLSPYILNKYNFLPKQINKSKSAINLFNNQHKKSNKKLFPNISNNHNSLKSGSSIIDISNIPNDINLNVFKTNTIFNFNPKNNIFIPAIQKRNLESVQSANIHKYDNNNFKSIEISTPISPNTSNKINLDIKNFHNHKKFHGKEKGFGKHFGNEKDCPICQSVSMKSKYIMKNMNHYHEFIKQRDQNTIKFNKEQFLQELKKPNTRSQKMEADIMKEIKQFIHYSKQEENMYNNQNDASIINAYFGL